MSKKVIRQFEEQFGKEWRCQCKAAFRPGNLEILSESDSSLLAHYQCPACGREQMLAAAISDGDVSEPVSNDQFIKLPKTTITADDVLDLKIFVQKMKFSTIKSIGEPKIRRKPQITVSRISSSKR